MMMKPDTFSDGINEIRDLSTAVSATDAAFDVDENCKELVAVFLETCSIARETNDSIVEMVRDSVQNGNNSLEFVKTLLERIAKLESDLRRRLHVKSSAYSLSVSSMFTYGVI